MAIKKLFSVIFILLILSATASAYGITEEDIWIFQGAYELGIGERAYLEGFTLKVHEINTGNENSATLLIYRNGVFKEAFDVDSTLNNEYIYNSELKIDVPDINEEKVSLEIYKKKSELVWITDIPKTSFKIGDTLTGNNYKISLLEINDEGALLSIEYEDKTTENTYKSGDYEKLSDNFMINVVYVKKDTKEVFIETLKPGAPEIKLEVANLKNSYEPNEYVEFELIVTNNGTIPLHGIILNTECEDGQVEAQTQQHSILDPEKSTKFNIKVKPEMEPEGKIISVVSKVQGYDYRGNDYHGETATEANVEPYISVEKEVYSRDKPSEDPEFGTEQYFEILINIENRANFQKAVTVTDDLPESFIPNDLENTEWAVAIDPGKTQTIEYFASPTEPGDFSFGPATVSWNDGGETYSLKSNEISGNFHVSGSKVIITKEISSSYMLIGEDIAVTIRISNDGDKNIEASFQEEIPEEVSLASGISTWKGEMKAGENKEFTYNIRAEEPGEIYLPATRLNFVDEDGRKDSIESREEFLYIDEPVPDDDTSPVSDNYPEEQVPENAGYSPEQGEMSRTEAAGFLASSFVALFCLIAIVPAFAYLYIIRIYK